MNLRDEATRQQWLEAIEARARPRDIGRATHILLKHQHSRRLASWRDPEGAAIKQRTPEEASRMPPNPCPCPYPCPYPTPAPTLPLPLPYPCRYPTPAPTLPLPLPYPYPTPTPAPTLPLPIALPQATRMLLAWKRAIDLGTQQITLT